MEPDERNYFDKFDIYSDEKFYEFNSHSRNIYENNYSATTSRMTGFVKLMAHWRGSVFKQIFHNVICFIVPYFILSLIYRFALTDHKQHRQTFELVCVYFDRYSERIPLSFLVGFYVQQVVTRWWDMFTSLPFPDRLALKLVCYCAGKDSFKKNLRRTVMRYVNLSTILVYRLVSKKVHDRFPTMESLIKAKLLNPCEAERLSKVDHKTPHESTWTPVLWALKLIQRAREEGKVKIEAPVYANLISSFEYIEIANRRILNYGWVEFPLAYTQVATLSVYMYFFAALFGRQFLDPHGSMKQDSNFNESSIVYTSQVPFDQHTPDMVVPLFTILEFACYMGWIKVAANLLNPFGDDDNDININYLIDRNLQVSYMIVDDADTDMEMTNDPFLEAGIIIPEQLPGYRSRQNSQRSNLGKKITSALSRSASRVKMIRDDQDNLSRHASTRTLKAPKNFSRQNSVVSFNSPSLQQRNINGNMSILSEESDTHHSNGSQSTAQSTAKIAEALTSTLEISDPWLQQQQTDRGELNVAFEDESNIRL